MSYVHLHNHSVFSFSDGAVTPEELVNGAVALGMPAISLTDHNNLCGGVAFYKAAVANGIKGILGCEITLENGSHLVLISKNGEGYSNLCRILTEGHLGSDRVEPRVKWSTLEKHYQGLIALSGCRRGEIPTYLLGRKYKEAYNTAQKYVNLLGRENFYLELQDNFLPGDSEVNKHLSELGTKLQVGLVATNNCHYLTREGFILHDLLTCVRTHTKLEEVHPERRLNGENYLKTVAQMEQLFSQYPQALENTLKIAQICEPPAFLGGNLFPEFITDTGETAPQMLRRLTFTGAEVRYRTVTTEIRERLDYELEIICQLGFADYFLLVWDLVQYARREQIRYAGRGSAADSAVAYCLYITEVDSIGRSLLFERFMSLERAQKPDIDIDFDSRYRDKVSAYVYNKYGADKVATVCTYNTYHFRSAIRELGKAMDFSAEELGVLAKKFPHYAYQSIDKLIANLPELRDSGLPLAKYQRLFDLVERVAGFPRFIGTHLGGLVVCRYPLVEITPLQQAAKGVVVTQFDKNYVEDLGLVKLDLLSLRTMSAIGDSLLTINAREEKLDYDAIPLDDKATYARLNKGKSIGVFQLESPAQRALQARLGADNLEDIIASVALIRPGPIQGNMVEPYISRRKGLEEVTYLHPKLKPILEKTYGVVLFQEQVIEIATVIAGFTPGEADRLRRVMTHARSYKEMEDIGREFRAKAVANGVTAELAETIFSYICSYASYGFCEAHAAAFATTAFKTAYLIEHHPAEFYCALLNHQPLGFYPVNTLCGEARNRGIAILPPDINESKTDFAVEGPAIRVGLKQVKGISITGLERLQEERSKGKFTSYDDFYRRLPPGRENMSRDNLESLILCGAFDALYPNRRNLLWYAGRKVYIPETPQQLLELAEQEESYPPIPDFTTEEKKWSEYQILHLNVREHFMQGWRVAYNLKSLVNSREIASLPKGTVVKTGGLVIRPHRPPTKSGRTVVFMSLEDEFGLVDVTVFEKTYQNYGKLIFGGPRMPLAVTGRVEHRGEASSVIAFKIEPLIQ